ncbi:DedA family protein, partial [uncultured Akkermansia sp.]
MHELISLWMSWVQDWGYAGVIVLMAMESSIFPVPSEVVIPPAAILSAQAGASMSFWGVVAAGTFGSWLGSAITYAVARTVGRPVVMRWGKFFFMPPHKVEKAEIFLQRYEVSGVFFARLLPVIRH